MECFLCIEVIIKPVICCGCGYTTCTPCAQKYLLSQPIGAHCMNPKCKIKWTLKFLLTLFTTTWVKTFYRDHLKKISLDRERSKLAETLAQIPRYKKEQEQQKKMKKLAILLQEAKAKTRPSQNQRWKGEEEKAEEAAGMERPPEVTFEESLLPVEMRFFRFALRWVSYSQTGLSVAIKRVISTRGAQAVGVQPPCSREG